jgi:two-component system nitrogen regulation response regulator GlnG/two-component system response regulator HydG
MSMGFGKTTEHGSATTSEEAGAQHCLALVIACSTAQPHRVGEIAFLTLGQWVFVGRGDDELEKFAQFVRQRPGEIAAVDPREGVLDGATLSRRQLRVRFMGDLVEVENIGGCRMYINGTECKKGVLRPGDTLRLKGEVVLVCVWRSRALPSSPSGRPLHAFGEADEYEIVGESEAAYRMRAQLESAAQGDDHVMIDGESGTGKELAAGVMQRRSSRARGPWVPRNAAIFTGTLVASELFGNPAGYPNPESPARPGLLGAAHRGTIFFDEIGDCPPDVQAQLLRVMETGEYQQQGETAVRRVDVRFIGATNRDDSFFRADFLARFRKRVRLPPLRERPEDIALLIRHLLALRAQKNEAFKKRFCREGKGGRIEPNLSGRLVDELVRHPLPTNVRQLEALLNEAVEASEAGEGNKVRLPSGGFKAGGAKAMAVQPGQRGAGGAKGAQGDAAAAGMPTREELVALLEQERGRVSDVARRLGMERTALYRLMERYGIKKGGRESGE